MHLNNTIQLNLNQNCGCEHSSLARGYGIKGLFLYFCALGEGRGQVAEVAQLVRAQDS